MLILIAHGSRNPRWCASIETLAESLQASVGPDKVRLAYMEHASPTLMDAASEAVRMGARRIRVLPLFLTAEGHVDRHIRPLVERLRENHAPVEVELLPPVGQHPLFRQLLHKVARESTE